LILDISDRKRLEHELRYHSEIDPLTNLANRKLFFQRLDNAIASANRFNYNLALLYLDLDGFKQVNDSFGHGEGDEVLIEVGRRLRRCVREVDTVARLGGDEFVIILNGTSKNMIADTAQRLINALTLTIIKNNIELLVSASIGIAIYPDDSISPATLLKYADAAMYSAKFKGKRQFCWHNNDQKIK
jgi:diguanylate cyclase (GGDEF)-like protein